jgi:hypothetical protein
MELRCRRMPCAKTFQAFYEPSQSSMLQLLWDQGQGKNRDPAGRLFPSQNANCWISESVQWTKTMMGLCRITASSCSTPCFPTPNSGELQGLRPEYFIFCCPSYFQKFHLVSFEVFNSLLRPSCLILSLQ